MTNERKHTPVQGLADYLNWYNHTPNLMIEVYRKQNAHSHTPLSVATTPTSHHSRSLSTQNHPVKK